MAAVGVTVFAAWSPSQSTVDGVYDLYHVGVHLGTLEVDGTRYRIRTRDPASGTWTPWTSAGSSEVAGSQAFDLPGALSGLPGRLGSLGRVDWGSHPAVAWPDASTVWRPSGPVGDDGATRWYVPGGSSPMDLVIGRGDEFLAAFDVRADAVLVRRGSEALTTVERWREPGLSQPVHGYRALPAQRVRGDDGVGLATLVYLPDGDEAQEPFPTILVRTPYGITNLISGYWHYVVRGYAVVLQAARGTAYWDPENRSEGEWEPMIHEPADGARAVEWIAEQPWSDGQVCMQGGSYVGYTQWSASMAAGSALRCLVPESSMGTAFSDQPYMGGGMVEGMAYYMFWMLDKPVRPGLSWSDILRHRPLMELDDFATGEDIPQWNTMLSHWRNDDYWQRQNWYADPQPRDFGA
ncbi:MAG: CocE/NonD family hydrolase, partial [Gemmatimonadetes bacterium]|nr:CocE/NonD family hydrolase [Gemmatimonadota bacterium]